MTFKWVYLFFPQSSISFVCFSNALPREEYVSLACSIILLWSEGSIYSPVGYSNLSNLPDDSGLESKYLMND